MKKLMARTILIILLLCCCTVFLSAENTRSEKTETGENKFAITQSVRYIAAAISIAVACIGAGIAIGQIGSAAMGAMSERPELAGRAIIYVGLAEGICLWGFLIAILILIIN